jgi:pimeloyl-ACP methyl ester carboxylesterase
MTQNENGNGGVRRFAGLGADLNGTADQRPPLVLLHGLTFDRSVWNATLVELSRLDPGRQTLSIDLPGHGQSEPSESYGMDVLVDLLHEAIDAAGLISPVMVGHSLAAIAATIYATKFPTSGVVNVDQSLRTEQFSGFLRSMDEQLRGPAFPTIWGGFLASMHIERLPPDAQELLRTTSTPHQDLVLGYWADVLTRSPAEMTALAEDGRANLRAANLPYMYVVGEEPDAQDRAWMLEQLPQTTIEVLPGSGHFPQLAHPDKFAQCLGETAGWPTRS